MANLFDIAVAKALSGGGGGGGSSDFSTATLTVVGERGALIIPTLLVVPEYNLEGSYATSMNLSSPYTIILYKGKAYLPLDSVQEISGNIELDSNTGLYVMTGDCTVIFGIS